MRPEVDFKSQSGFSIASAMIGMAVTGVAAAGFLNMYSNTSRAAKSSGLRLDLQGVHRQISERLSCPVTMASFGSARPIPCNGDVVLRDSNNNPLFRNGRIGAWTISARCEVRSGQNGLSIFATMKDRQGRFMKDPLNPSLILNQDSPISRLFSDGMRPCQGYFDALPAFRTCPNPTDYIAGVNFETQQLDCRPTSVADPSAYISQVSSPAWSCGGANVPVYATCPSNWIAASCGYRLVQWNPQHRDQSNAPDLSMASSTNTCTVVAGGRPGHGVCFKSIATCINLLRVANGH